MSRMYFKFTEKNSKTGEEKSFYYPTDVWTQEDARLNMEGNASEDGEVTFEGREMT